MLAWRERSRAGAPAILIGDADHKLFARAAITLQGEGYRVVSAQRGGDVLALAVAIRPAVIVIDVRFPDVDGRDVLRDIKRDRRIRGIPVLVLSQRDYEADRLIAEELGAAAYMPKAQLALFTETVMGLISRAGA